MLILMATHSASAASKLFRVLVAGGLAMAAPACSSGSEKTELDAAASGDDAASDAGFDAKLDAAAAADACLNRPGDCTHGLCSW